MPLQTEIKLTAHMWIKYLKTCSLGPGIVMIFTFTFAIALMHPNMCCNALVSVLQRALLLI